MTEDNLNQYNEAWENYVVIANEYSTLLMNFRTFYNEHVTLNYYAQMVCGCLLMENIMLQRVKRIML